MGLQWLHALVGYLGDEEDVSGGSNGLHIQRALRQHALLAPEQPRRVAKNEVIHQPGVHQDVHACEAGPHCWSNYSERGGC